MVIVESDSSLVTQGPAALPLGNGQRVLFVDDEPLLTRLGEHFLRRLGYQPATATSPLRAVKLMEEQPFEVVVTDLTMPELSGIELGRKLQEIAPGVRIILTTAYHHLLEEKNVLSLGFSALLLKPYNLQSLARVLRDALESTPVPEV
jgi:two-component system, cell cycle sensor histidine kinase and response regulator CckA